jgi:8-oxo-dGTP pyrophosphatase MutT (NUDIX family)
MAINSGRGEKVRVVEGKQCLVALIEEYLQWIHYAGLEPKKQQSATAKQFLSFVCEHDNCFERSCIPGHLTASAWILDPFLYNVLLVEHRKLKKWIQPGGHADGQFELAQAAAREALEEVGARDLTPLNLECCGIFDLGKHCIFDLDIHYIPADQETSAHVHYDVRFAFSIDPYLSAVPNSEITDWRWLPLSKRSTLTDEPSLARMAAKSRLLSPVTVAAKQAVV